MGIPVNAAHWHLVLNHLPIFFVLIGMGILIAGMIRDSVELTATALVLFIVAGAGSYVVIESGESAEEIVESNNQLREETFEQHEEYGETAGNIIMVLGALSLAYLLYAYYQGTFYTWASGVILLITFAGLYYLLLAASFGGKARHPEIRSKTQPVTAPPASTE
ncbi:MAG: hypothetical protein ABEK50_18895, partial [bacterium]